MFALGASEAALAARLPAIHAGFGCPKVFPIVRRRESPVKSQGEIEAAIGAGVSRFEQEYMGRGPRGVHAHLLGDMLVVRLLGVLTAAEQQLVKSLPAEKGRNLLKDVRTQLIEQARPQLEAMVLDVTG